MRICTLLYLISATLAQAQQNEVTRFAENNRQMNKAIASAQTTLPLFLCNVVDDEGYSIGTSYIKIEVPTNLANGDDEIIWVGPFAVWSATDFSGFLANDPVGIDGYARGDQFNFTYNMIVDWAHQVESGTRFGDYTTRVIMAQMDTEQSAEVIARFAEPPVPTDWTCEE